ncbi:MAG: beta-lactamase family protein, partial [Anaerolineae bacterium]|nr:beta-lactamase family protein [Anaerolineae bacterium]
MSLGLLAETASVQPTSPSASYTDIDAYIQGQMRRLNIPGVSLAIVEGDQIVHRRGFGRARPGGEAPTPQTPFVLGSTTKSFTALAILQLVEAGRLDVDAPVQRYLPWFCVADPTASAVMTVRHLLHQTSGFPMLAGLQFPADLDDSLGATEQQAAALSTLRLTRPVGAAWEYSNLNYDVLGLIIEAVSGEAYADYVERHIFAPLDMRHSYTSRAAARQHGLAVGHRYWFACPGAAPTLRPSGGSLPAGLLISCAEDMAHWLIAHLNGGRYGNGQVLSPAGIEALHRGAADVRVMNRSVGEYGMGWFVETIGQTQVVWHSGNVPEFSSYMALLPAQKKALVLLLNADHYGLPFVLEEFGARVAALLAGQAPAPVQLGFIPWAMRALALIPLLQVIGVAATLRRLRAWRRDPALRPTRGWAVARHVL